MSDKTGKHTLVEEGTEFTGTLTSKCPIVVMGKVEGDITGPNIHVTTTGVVAGNVKVKELRSEGELAGTVEAEAVHIAGRVRDKTVIRAKTLQVTLQSSQKAMEVVFGECELAIGDEPNKAAAIAGAQPEPAKAEPQRRRGASEMWEEGAKAPVTEAAKTPAEADDERPARKRGTQPPPA
jgi:cytoskeletal protein CcmA (bactofilin family)